ncbi:MAG TPA: NADH-quinone oxidoreductase subunit L [Chitinophagaceae bacterium]|nr:NADH-quinone oxidoreductase subunit L [Chitinophagaceae bacterium]
MIKLVYLIPLFPFIGFLLNGLGRRAMSKSLIGIVGSGMVLASFVVSLLIFSEVRQEGFQPQTIHLFPFIQFDSISIPFALQVDQLSALFLLIITGVGFLIHLYSTAYMHEEDASNYGRYFSYLNLFVFFMLLLVLGANYVIMFIGWEGVGLCSYLLIGYWFTNDAYNNAAKKAFIMNRIGDLGFLIAVFWMILQFGSATFTEVFAEAPEASTAALTGITLLLFAGATGKSAQIPLYTWLPDAMAGPTPVSALIHAATMVTAGVYMIARSNVLYSLAPISQYVVAIAGLATAILAATIALKQNDIKKVLAYSTVSQLGYMFLGLGVGAYVGAVFHVMTHAFFKALLFLGAGSVIHAMHHEQDIRKMGGLKKRLPITHITFLLACLAIAGIPPFSGFFSKDEILIAAYAHNPVLYWIGLGGALLTAFYMFRLYAMTFLGSFRGTAEQEHHVHESPAAMTIPLVILAVLSVVGGFVGLPDIFNEKLGTHHYLDHFLSPVMQGADGTAHTVDHSTEYILLAVSVLAIGITCIVAANMYRRYRYSETAPAGIGRAMENKWYVDELYDAIIVRPLKWLAWFFNSVIEKLGIDALVNGVGRAVQYSGRQLRLLQSGQVGTYVLLMVVSLVIFFIIEFFIRK